MFGRGIGSGKRFSLSRARCDSLGFFLILDKIDTGRMHKHPILCQFIYYFLLLEGQSSKMGLAIKIDEYVPEITPTSITNAKSFITSPPRK